jgi:LmbE family N-acetylglucosaminyl deacetylase
MGLVEFLAAQAADVPAPRTAVVVAHPDDEVIGAGSRLPRLSDALFVYVTDGAPRNGSDAARNGLDVDGYRERRRREREAALARCGVQRERIVDLGSPDQQASLQLVRLSRELAAILDAHAIEAVLTQPYEGGHPDHDATAFVAHAAARLATRGPEVVEMSSYHAGPHGMAYCEFLPHRDAGRESRVVLGDVERGFKQALIDCHASQRDTLRGYPLDVECFRRAPAYDFTQAPHEGTLWYEPRPWGMSGARFRQLAAEALTQLGLAGR